MLSSAWELPEVESVPTLGPADSLRGSYFQWPPRSMYA